MPYANEIKTAKDIITEDNVLRTYNQGKYVVFVLKNGIKVKVDPNASENKKETTV